MVAELSLVRLAVGLENALSTGFYRVGAGRPFADGSAATILHPPSQPRTAEARMKHGRGKITWLNASELSDAIEAVVDPTDACHNRLRSHGSTLAQVRRIRNHIAHRNRNSSQQFQIVVQSIYGARLNNVTPGTLLLTPRGGPTPLIRRLIIGSRTAVTEVFRG